MTTPKPRNIAEAAEPLLRRCIELLVSKNQDYGSGNLLATGVRGAAIRWNDKVRRVLTLTEEGREGGNDETVGDTFLDGINYPIIGKLLSEGLLFEKQKLVYLAGPIDVAHWTINQREEYAINNWRSQAVVKIAEAGHASYNPKEAFEGADYRVAKPVVTINRAAIESCDVVLARLVDGITLGTAREIEFAKSIGKRVIAVLPNEYAPFAVHDLENVYGGLEEAIKHI